MTFPIREPSPTITLTSDFGWRDGFVAVMKGVILGINPSVTLVDISHDIPQQNIAHGAFVLGTTCGYFPGGTIHLAVVDPGVGTERRPILLVTPDAPTPSEETGRSPPLRTFYVAPDNGLLTYVIMAHQALPNHGVAGTMEEDAFLRPTRVLLPEACSAYVLDRDEYWLKPVSNTFHGRDIFAPVAAHLSNGVAPDALGTPVEEIVCLNVPRPLEKGNVISGRVIHIDHFGNLVSNIRSGAVTGSRVEVEVKGRSIRGLSLSYASPTGLLAIVGSHGYLEIAERNGNASDLLGAMVGTSIRVTLLD